MSATLSIDPMLELDALMENLDNSINRHNLSTPQPINHRFSTNSSLSTPSHHPSSSSSNSRNKFESGDSGATSKSGDRIEQTNRRDGNVDLKMDGIQQSHQEKLLSSSTLSNVENEIRKSGGDQIILNVSTISSNSSNTNTFTSQSFQQNSEIHIPSDPPAKPPRLKKSNRKTTEPKTTTPKSQISNHSSPGNVLSQNPMMVESNSAVDSLDKILADLENMNMGGLSNQVDKSDNDFRVSLYSNIPNNESQRQSTNKLAENLKSQLIEEKEKQQSSQQVNDIKEDDHKQLKFLLSELSSSLEKDGISVNPRGVCAACDQTILGEVIHALGKKFHPEHFFCSVCQNEIGNESFIERNEKVYCEPCYTQYFTPSCPKCDKPVTDFCTEAMGKKWHPECFICTNCSRSLGDEVFLEKNSKPYCENCYNNLYAPICKRCKNHITTKFIFALDNYWHQDCFSCMSCVKSFPGGKFFEFENEPYCEDCYYVKKGNVCFACNKVLKNANYIEALNRKYHVEHFICAYFLGWRENYIFFHQQKKDSHVLLLAFILPIRPVFLSESKHKFKKSRTFFLDMLLLWKINRNPKEL